jgi:threonine aldolase
MGAMSLPTEPGAVLDHTFASDNTSGVHPDVMAALGAANTGHAIAYGDDRWTVAATQAFRDLLGDVDVLFCWGGTGANVVGLQTMLAPHQAVVCAESAHIAVDECGAPERFVGCKLIDLPTDDGRLAPAQVEAQLHLLGDEHHVQPHVVSVTQSTELGTLYAADEIRALAEVAHANGLLLHVDGARVANAAAALGGDVRSFTADAGVDVMTFGGTKNGAMYGEAVVWFDRSLARDARFARKQAGQLPSKARFVAAQLGALLHDDLWLRNATHANAMAARLVAAVQDVPGLELAREPAVNSVFVRVPAKAVADLQQVSPFYVWDASDPERTEVRWMCSWDTTADHVDAFADGVRRVLAG